MGKVGPAKMPGSSQGLSWQGVPLPNPFWASSQHLEEAMALGLLPGLTFGGRRQRSRESFMPGGQR